MCCLYIHTLYTVCIYCIYCVYTVCMYTCIYTVCIYCIYCVYMSVCNICILVYIYCMYCMYILSVCILVYILYVYTVYMYVCTYVCMYILYNLASYNYPMVQMNGIDYPSGAMPGHPAPTPGTTGTPYTYTTGAQYAQPNPHISSSEVCFNGFICL